MPVPEGVLARLAAEVRSGRRSAEQLVEESLNRIEAGRPLNAVIAVRPDEARREASRIDEAARRGRRTGALAGLPLLVKDCDDVAGMTTTWGSAVFRGSPPASRDSLVVQRLRTAGAVVVGKTNLSEFAFKAHASNPLFGATRNPWAMDCSPGGSSGGSAAAMIAGLAPLCTASDGGGSIRIPASICGLVGLKPTNGIVARDPIPPWPDLTTHGPITTTVADAGLLLRVLAGPGPGDPGAQQSWSPGRAGLPRRALAVARIVPGAPLPDETQRLFDAALAAVDGIVGVPVEPFDGRPVLPDGNVDDDWFRIAGAEQLEWLGRETVAVHAPEMDPAFVDYMEQAMRISVDEYLAARRRRYRYARQLDDLLGGDTVILSPTVTVSGWSPEGRMPGAAAPGLPFDAFNTQVQNVTGHPAITVPAGRFANGVAFGLQVTGPRYRDSVLLAFAAAWEAARPWPTVADGFASFAWSG